MTINIQIKEPLESKLNKSFTKLVSKNKFITKGAAEDAVGVNQEAIQF